MIEEVLLNLDLTKEEVEIYLSLLNRGTQNANDLSKNTSVKRTYVYKICEGLLKKGLVGIEKKDRTTVFAPKSPDHLLSLAEDKKIKAEKNETALEGILASLKGAYRTIEERPIVTTYDGIEGLKKIYKNILEEKEDILLLRSVFDDKRTDLDKIVTEQIANQVKSGIHVRTITPLEEQTKEVYLKHDRKHLVKRHIIRSINFDLPSQIIIYKTKVAIISLKKDIVCTLIDNADIASTFKKLFESLWEYSKTEHEEIVAKWDKY